VIASTRESATATIFSWPDVRRELGDEVQMVELPWRTHFSLLLEGEA
jgi:hypothetical protein